jgi:Protein of unknown function (DUF4232)
MKPLLIGALAAIGLMTCACSGSAPAAQPARTVTVTASPSASHSSAAATPSAATSSPAAAACLTRDLNGSVGQPQGTAGGLVIVIVFKNLNTVPCTLYGYPGVALAAGTPVSDIGQPSTEYPATPRTLVTLPPGGFASAKLQIANAANYPAGTCKPVKASWLEVIPPNQKVPLNISFGSTACKGSVKLLQVTTVQEGSAG